MAVTHPTTNNRTVARIKHEPGQTVVEQIETGSIIKKSTIRLTGKIKQNSGANKVRDSFGQILSLIRRFEIKVNEQDTIVSLDGAGLFLMAQRDYGINPYGWKTVPVLPSPDEEEFEIYLPIAHYLPRAVGPLLTALDLRGARNCHVSIEWALDPLGALYRDPSGDMAVTDIQCEVIADFIGNLPADTPRALVRQLKYKSEPIISDDEHWEFKIGRGNGTLLKSIVILTTRDKYFTRTGNERYGPIFVGNLEVAAGEQVFKSVPPEWYLANEHSVNQYVAPAGVIPIEFADMFDTGQMLNMNDLDSDLVLRAPVEGSRTPEEPAKVSVYTDCVRSPRWGN